MNRRFVLYTAGLLLVAVQAFLSCSSPLDDVSGFGGSPPRIIIIVDTLIVVDTVIIVVTDSTGNSCERLSATRQELVWLFSNSEGSYNLEFLAYSESDRPPQMLVVIIDDQEFMWDPNESMEFSLNLDLKENASVWIISENPHAYGHSIDICLTVSEE